MIKAIEKSLNSGNQAEIKIEHGEPVVVEIKRKLAYKKKENEE